MRRRVTDEASGGLRGTVLFHYEARLAGRPWSKRFYGPMIEKLRAGEPLVLSAWQLYRYLPASVIPRGVHAQYRLEPDGQVVEIDREELRR